MENHHHHSHSRNQQKPKKTYNGNNNKYDDVFGGPPKFKTPSLSPRLEDYSEIFSRVSSIPILDLPVVNGKNVYVDVRSNGFDYREVFGGFNDLDSAPCYDELFIQPVDGGDSSDDAWTHEEVDTVSGRSKSVFSNGRDSCDSIDGYTEFNISYNKGSSMNGTNMSSGGVIHVADLGAINGYTVAVDGTRKEIGPSSVGRGISSSMYGFEEKDGGQEYYRESFVTVSEIGLRTDPTGVPPPSRPAPVLKSEFRSSGSNSRTTGSEGSADGSSPKFFDVEVDASSATLREAMVNAQVKLKSAKELFERKRDGVRTTTKQSSMKNRVMNEEGRSLRDKRGSKSFSSRESTNSDGNDEWEEATEFVELVRTEQPKNAVENSGGKDGSFPLNAGFFDQKMTWAANVEWENQQRRGKGDRKDHEAKRLLKHPGVRKVASRHKRHEDKLGEKAPEESKNEKLRDFELGFEIGNSLPDHDGIVKHRNRRRPEENKLLAEKLPRQKKDLHCEEKTKSRQDQQSDRIPHQKAAVNPGMFNWEQNARKLREALGLADNESTLEVSLESKGNGKSLGIRGEKDESEIKLNDALRRMEEETRPKESRLKEESERREREAFAKAEKEKKVKAALEQAEKVKKLKEAREREENERRAAEAREKAEQERKMKEQEEFELRLKEEQNRRMREAREKAEQERKMKEQEEYELRLKEAFEKEEKNRRTREAREKAEYERKLKVALEQEKEQKIKEAREKEENERRIKDAREKAELEQRRRETLEQEEKERRIKEIQEREEKERRAKEVLEQAENERKLKEALELKEKERKLKEARDKEENEKKLKEAIELEEKEKRLLEAFERAETERRLKEDLEQEEMRLQEAKEREEERAHRENQEHQEKKKSQHEFTREESDKKQRDAREITKEAHGEQWPKESLNDTLEDDESVESNDAVNEQEEAEPSQRVSMSEEACPWKVFEKNLKNASQSEGTNEEETQLGQNGESGEESASVTDNSQGGKVEQKSKRFESTKDASVLKRDVEDEKVDRDQRNQEESKCANKTSFTFRDPENKYTRQQERGSIYETQEGLNKDAKLERPLPSQVYEQREKKAERLKRERDLEMERLRKIEEEREREREREKDRMAFDQRALADARERLEKACAEAREKSLPDKVTMEGRLRAERAAVERATTEARERAAEKAAFEARERMERSVSDKHFQSSGLGERMEKSVSDKHFQNSASFGASRYQNGTDGESPQRYTSRLERHRRTADRVAKALAEKNMRDLVAQREQTERTRIAETLDTEVKRWSNGKEGNIRALLSTLQYILGSESGWQPLPLTEVITSAAVKRAYRKATLCVHPDKLQQRGANIHQKYICEKVFDLLKEAWNRFNSEER